MSPAMQALVITATLNMLGNFTPVSCTVLQLCHDKLIVLLSSPVPFDDIRIENDVPPLMALLFCPSTDILGDCPPVFSSINSNCLPELLILFLCPMSFHQNWISHLLPPVLTLIWSSFFHHLGDLLPIIGSQQLYSLSQFIVLLEVPKAASRSKSLLS